eukprot:TRINITY_DN846_c0_g1_i1.p1 TRINITY_DN846_c0_g1~~TRINITY_DN846_c0_g1_i1.p1  ORF type:complete len:185 (+),score=8.25 TRINITY_DN846_c0_g1_i1:665-1219(+)
MAAALARTHGTILEQESTETTNFNNYDLKKAMLSVPYNKPAVLKAFGVSGNVISHLSDLNSVILFANSAALSRFEFVFVNFPRFSFFTRKSGIPSFSQFCCILQSIFLVCFRSFSSGMSTNGTKSSAVLPRVVSVSSFRVSNVSFESMESCRFRLCHFFPLENSEEKKREKNMESSLERQRQFF